MNVNGKNTVYGVGFFVWWFGVWVFFVRFLFCFVFVCLVVFLKLNSDAYSPQIKLKTLEV